MNTRSLRIFLPVIIVLLTLASLREILHPAPGAAAAINLALNKSAKASSVASGGSTYAANRAVDGSTTTRWMSKAVDPSWIYVDLKQVRTFTESDSIGGPHTARPTSCRFPITPRCGPRSIHKPTARAAWTTSRD